ncbi:hypothetical protein ACS0TY_010764 [Phlomoides rotata]
MVSALESLPEDREVIELEKEMWDKFYGAGFWRSPSQRRRMDLDSNPDKINSLVPVDLVIDHSVQVDVARSENDVQVNLEYLGRVVFNIDGILYPDMVGTDSHTTMIDGLGVAGWRVGGIEAEAAMLGHISESDV